MLKGDDADHSSNSNNKNKVQEIKGTSSSRNKKKKKRNCEDSADMVDSEDKAYLLGFSLAETAYVVIVMPYRDLHLEQNSRDHLNKFSPHVLMTFCGSCR